jgi:hypothetical protein
MIVTDLSQCGPLQRWEARSYRDGQIETWECIDDAAFAAKGMLGEFILLPLMLPAKALGYNPCRDIGGVICYPISIGLWLAILWLLSPRKGR